MAPSLLFIPDISGFTKFVNNTAAEHGRHIIAELLDLIIESNELSLTVSELEGDAVFGSAQPLKLLVLLRNGPCELADDLGAAQVRKAQRLPGELHLLLVLFGEEGTLLAFPLPLRLNVCDPLLESGASPLLSLQRPEPSVARHSPSGCGGITLGPNILLDSKPATGSSGGT